MTREDARRRSAWWLLYAALGVATCASCTFGSGSGVGVGVGVGAPVGGPSELALDVSPRVHLAAEPAVPLGDQSIVTLRRPSTGLAIADSLVRRWGWHIADLNNSRNVLHTEWLYFEGPRIAAGSGHQCDDAAVVGLRLTVEATRAAADTMQFAFIVHADARLLPGSNRSNSERLARRGLTSIGEALTKAFANADDRTDRFVAPDILPRGVTGTTTAEPRIGRINCNGDWR